MGTLTEGCSSGELEAGRIYLHRVTLQCLNIEGFENSTLLLLSQDSNRAFWLQTATLDHSALLAQVREGTRAFLLFEINSKSSWRYKTNAYMMTNNEW